MRRRHSPEEVARLQFHLAHARHHLLYGAGSPLQESLWAASPTLTSSSGAGLSGGDAPFQSQAVSHLLQQAFELARLPPGTRYRRFKPAFSKCLDLTQFA
mmetsp:Transcript_82010/g.163850  ORF Transcript_82010/g.163850 Transcript_82010/m.163850 type:complete len:100 (+) Transcript_82010:110-409(+)